MCKLTEGSLSCKQYYIQAVKSGKLIELEVGKLNRIKLHLQKPHPDFYLASRMTGQEVNFYLLLINKQKLQPRSNQQQFPRLIGGNLENYG
ncbi:hypothetical protein [aff. Roholtiella sp. LEGE 12411]|uniref:hypothetical protein n=1 Tax=aff. Roholtiella sp. LEGE 12411 TaxID=1828822 RepID=UPI00187DE7A0|nr:hypothetical protein [aff. Roholtiella sp. LEGE 12411]MBE9034385.1 hypothetical protein [aff. Roholtiella sp. LEGE 12411]